MVVSLNHWSSPHSVPPGKLPWGRVYWNTLRETANAPPQPTAVALHERRGGRHTQTPFSRPSRWTRFPRPSTTRRGVSGGPLLSVGVAIGSQVLDLTWVAAHPTLLRGCEGLPAGADARWEDVFAHGSLNAFMALG